MIDFPQEIKRLTRFGIVGALAAAVYYALLWTMVEVFSVSVLLASSSAFIFVTIENYLLHYTWSFRSTKSHTKAFPRFLAMNIGGFGINWLIMFAGVVIASLNYLLVQALAIAVVVAWNLALSYLWIFRESEA